MFTFRQKHLEMATNAGFDEDVEKSFIEDDWNLEIENEFVPMHESSRIIDEDGSDDDLYGSGHQRKRSRCSSNTVSDTILDIQEAEEILHKHIDDVDLSQQNTHALIEKIMSELIEKVDANLKAEAPVAVGKPSGRSRSVTNKRKSYR